MESREKPQTSQNKRQRPNMTKQDIQVTSEMTLATNQQHLNQESSNGEAVSQMKHIIREPYEDKKEIV